MTQGTIYNNKLIRKALAEFIRDTNADYFVTANFNRATNYTAARRALKGWHARLDKKLLGGSWSRKAQNERTLFMAFVEHEHSNLHWHLLLRLGDGADAQRFEAVAGDCWRGLIKSGELDVNKLNTLKDRARTASYATKELWRHGALERFVLSTEFAA